MRVSCLLFLVVQPPEWIYADAHGALFIPTPRNAIDSTLPGWEGGKSPTQSCTCTNGNAGGDSKSGCDEGLRGPAGQSCLWWNQGCSIGCAKCVTDPSLNFSDFTGHAPQAGKIGFRRRYCNDTWNSAGAPVPMINSTLAPEAWTLNIGAEDGSEEDSYRYNPWRAPGYAPVIDPCGQAGGEIKGQNIGGDSIYTETKFAKMGDLGSKLPPSVNKTQWTAGEYVEVGWGVLYNHGGGYQYRLCKLDTPGGLTEECFQQTPLEFDVTGQTLVWNTKSVPGNTSITPAVPKGGTLRYPVPHPVFVNTGTWPKGSTWARSPLPRRQDGRPGLHNASSCVGSKPKPGLGCLGFEPPCPWDNGEMLPCKGTTCHGTALGSCSSDWTVGLVSDRVLIPKDLTPGDYVLSFRWDCEETAQIWANCADVTISA